MPSISTARLEARISIDLHALLSPPQISPALERAFARRQKILRRE